MRRGNLVSGLDGQIYSRWAEALDSLFKSSPAKDGRSNSMKLWHKSAIDLQFNVILQIRHLRRLLFVYFDNKHSGQKEEESIRPSQLTLYVLPLPGRLEEWQRKNVRQIEVEGEEEKSNLKEGDTLYQEALYQRFIPLCNDLPVDGRTLQLWWVAGLAPHQQPSPSGTGITPAASSLVIKETTNTN